jgi:toxin ParE1/3/4
MARIVWLPETIQTIDAIRIYIAHFNPSAADPFVRSIVAAGNSLQDYPNRGRPVGRYRELSITPPYVIRYRVEADTVYIVRIKHGRQRS